ncbi:MAG: tetratricopeptide repeat protein [Alphaproteobacteria bacterium]|nr:tetratricopeptide repeat protein [Alphaproteobacteria bacterium]
MDALEEQAGRLYDQKQYPEALDIYLSLAKKYPKTEKYSIFCGNCYDALGQTEEAIRYYKKASKINPVSTTSLLALANLYYNNEDYKAACKFSNMILQKSKNNVSALLILGNVAYCQKQFDKAFALYEKVYHLDGSSYIALINMANTCYDLGKYVKAVDFASQAIRLYSSSVDAYIILGNSYTELGKLEKAEASLLKALSFRADNPWIYNALSRVYQKMEDYKSALSFAWKSVLFGGNVQDDQHINFGYLLYECAEDGKEELAKHYARKWQEAFLDNKVVEFMAGAVLEDKKIKKADPHYIEKIFDIFAIDFENTLKGLDYMAPEYVAESVKKNFKKDFWKKTNYLDLGCGTGMCAQKVKKYIGWSTITGIDLSQKMLDQAAQKGIYKRLEQVEIVGFLERDMQEYQLITAADVLTYFGDLRSVFEGVASRLELGGLFVFSISENLFTTDDFLLMPSGRFVHNMDYVMTLLKKCGYAKLSQERKALRNEGDKVVWGYVVAAEKVIIIEK